MTGNEESDTALCPDQGGWSQVSIYTLSDPIGGHIRYVGASYDPLVRLKGHISNARSAAGATPKDEWILGLQTQGLIPIIRVLETLSLPESHRAERRWIARFRGQGEPLLNRTDGGEYCPTGWRPKTAPQFRLGEIVRLRYPHRVWTRDFQPGECLRVYSIESLDDGRDYAMCLCPVNEDGSEDWRGKRSVAFPWDSVVAEEYLLHTREPGIVLPFQIGDRARLINPAYFRMPRLFSGTLVCIVRVCEEGWVWFRSEEPDWQTSYYCASKDIARCLERLEEPVP